MGLCNFTFFLWLLSKSLNPVGIEILQKNSEHLGLGTRVDHLCLCSVMGGLFSSYTWMLKILSSWGCGEMGRFFYLLRGNKAIGRIILTRRSQSYIKTDLVCCQTLISKVVTLGPQQNRHLARANWIRPLSKYFSLLSIKGVKADCF